MRIDTNRSSHSIVKRESSKQQEQAIQEEMVPPEVKKQQSAGEAMERLLKENETIVKTAIQQLGLSGEQAKAEKEKLKVMLTCLEISRRISAGDKVPRADHQYLMKHDFGLYARSISMRFPKNNPHEYKRLSEHEPQDELQVGDTDSAQNLKETVKSQPTAQAPADVALDVKA